MTLKSALQDLRETTLVAVHGALGRLAYVASLRRADSSYEHWGLAQVHGARSSERALRTAHMEALAQVLRMPLPALVEDLRASSETRGITAAAYAEELSGQLDNLLPEEGRNTPAANHLSSVLLALSRLEKVEKSRRSPKRATRSTS